MAAYSRVTQYDRVKSQSSSKKKACFDMTTDVKDDFGHVSDVTCQGWLTIKIQESSRVLEGIQRELSFQSSHIFLTPVVFNFLPLTAAIAAPRFIGSLTGREEEEEAESEEVEAEVKAEVVEELLGVAGRGEMLAKEF
ncbi:hypothetical protein MMC22_009433 [Lobaria immixta]|nr:hypothetical protein [Lobaria immixta]